MGTVVDAVLAANAAEVVPATITATCRRTSSAASAGSRSFDCIGPAIVDGHVLALDKARVFQALAEWTQAVRVSVKRCWVKKPDYRHSRLLPARRERPRDRAAEQRDELAPPIKKMTGHDTTARSSTPSTPNLSRLSSSRVGQKAGA
jgi:hypothetical protein